MLRRRIRWALLMIAVAGVVTGGVIYWHHQRYKHFHVHEQGMVYRSAWLEPDAMQEVIETHQIRTVVNLCAPGEMGEQRWIDEREAVRNSGARLVELPMTLSVDPDHPEIAKHLKILGNPDSYPILVHCQHGVTRTAKYLAIYDIAFRGKSGRESLEAQPLFGRDEHNVNVRAFVKNFEKEHRKLYPTARADRLSILR